MTPEDKQLLELHIKEIAKILYKNTPPEKIETFEGIEISIRDQVLEYQRRINTLPLAFHVMAQRCNAKDRTLVPKFRFYLNSKTYNLIRNQISTLVELFVDHFIYNLANV